MTSKNFRQRTIFVYDLNVMVWLFLLGLTLLAHWSVAYLVALPLLSVSLALSVTILKDELMP